MANLGHQVGHEYDKERAEGNSAVGLHISHHHTTADTATASDTSAHGGDYGYESRQASRWEAAHARHGQQTATRVQHTGPFTPSNGMHSTGQDHVAAFSRSIRFAGGVRQGSQYTSDAASGVARGNTSGDGGARIKVQKQGAGDTFENRQHRRWAGRGG